MNSAARADAKTITRRLLKIPKSFGVLREVASAEFLNEYGFINVDTNLGHGYKVKCPYGKVGDRLYIKETYAIKDTNESYVNPACWYAVDFTHPRDFVKSMKSKWIGGIYMPKRCARTYLEIVSLRVERVQDISGADAILEGVLHEINFDFVAGYEHAKHEAQRRFEILWKKLNCEKSWIDNPYVWAIEFKRVNDGK